MHNVYHFYGQPPCMLNVGWARRINEVKTIRHKKSVGQIELMGQAFKHSRGEPYLERRSLAFKFYAQKTVFHMPEVSDGATVFSRPYMRV